MIIKSLIVISEKIKLIGSELIQNTNMIIKVECDNCRKHADVAFCRYHYEEILGEREVEGYNGGINEAQPKE